MSRRECCEVAMRRCRQICSYVLASVRTQSKVVANGNVPLFASACSYKRDVLWDAKSDLHQDEGVLGIFLKPCKMDGTF